MSDLALPVPARPLGGRELQFLREASNSKGRAAGHNNTMVIALERDGLLNHECAEDGADSAAVVGGEAVAALSSAGFAVVPS